MALQDKKKEKINFVYFIVLIAKLDTIVSIENNKIPQNLRN